MPFEPGSPEWHSHVAEIEAEELKQPYQWWYLSFAGDENDPRSTRKGWLGAAILRARGFTLAITLANTLGINPGGCEVQGHAIPEEAGYQPPVELTGRLLSWEDLEQAYGDLVDWNGDDVNGKQERRETAG